MIAAQPRLTRLELHGFKSFANRTVFTFERGITSIIGPNGSGKSNISDAVRWVLGEQSHSTLRSKKTEDVIFAGGSGKAPAGMAEVAVTFDNSTGWLPTEFAEVTITRRAFRSGENQYLINGRKVRLKDVTHLTASLGHSHTVVGQGLVDTALSQRPEERRGLFEHAADLTGLRLKAAEAERNLAETETNSSRISDLLNELEPRLKTLERAAKQAREWKGVYDRLKELQTFHYARLLADANARFQTAEKSSTREDTAVETRRFEVERLVLAGAEARERLEQSRALLDQHAARLQATIDQARRIGYERDLASERLAALTRRREDMADTQAGLDEQVATVERELVAVTADLATVEQEVETSRRSVAGLARESAAAREARADTERAVGKLFTISGEQERKAAELGRRRALLEQRRETDAAERERAEKSGLERADRITRLTAELAAFDVSETAGQTELDRLETQIKALISTTEQAAIGAVQAQNSLAEMDRTIGQTSARLEALKRIHESGTGMHAGVREVVLASRSGKLNGIRGAVAELIEVPAEYDTAIEVALGGHLQDVVVDRWVDAEAAINHLKKSNSGRATFQPLDTVRASRRDAGTAREALAVRGAIGIACDLVKTSSDVAIVVSSLLGRTLVVGNLDAARAALPHLPIGWSAVTLSGEISRTGGSVTGGAAVRESGMLGRERELRELPTELKRLDKKRTEAVDTVKTTSSERQKQIEERQRLEGERVGLLAARKERQGQRARLVSWVNEVTSEQTAVDRRLSALANSAESLEVDIARLTGEQSMLADETSRTLAERNAAEQELSTGAEAATAAEAAHSTELRIMAGLEERFRSERKREAGLRAQRTALDEELSLRSQRAAALDGEITAITSQRERLVQEADGIASARDAVAAEHPPLEAAVRETEREVTQIDKALEIERSALLEAERSRGASGLGVERIRGELATIRQRISDELELIEPDDLLSQDIIVPEGAENPIETEREIARLKDRLRRVGYVGENVVEEYDREAERHIFLRTQLDDVQGAAASLHKLLDELHATMRARFDETFARVSTAFTEMFSILFGGGTARLVMTSGNSGDGGGIDIVAQPPGKRLQSLGLLSGGERALTAAALLFAILQVNPTPFCMLDEVDAALDEANVVRFRDQLRSLAAETQAIIITHNRGTIEVADTLYGVSMRDDGVSQVLSLRLADVVLAGE